MVVNLGYDWLPLYLTSFLAVPVVHFISMGSLNDAMDAAIHDLARRSPDRLGAHSRAQADTFDRVDRWSDRDRAVPDPRAAV